MNTFKQAIQSYIAKEAAKDANFAERVKDKKKNIDDCLTYILNKVREMKASVLSNEEVFGMAIHYYQEGDIKVGSKVSAVVKVTSDALEDPKENVVKMKPKKRKPTPEEVEQFEQRQLSLF